MPTLTSRAVRIAALTAALTTGAALTIPLPADAASYRKVDSWERDWPGGHVLVEEIVHPRYPGWVEISVSGWIRDSAGRRAPAHLLECFNGFSTRPALRVRSSRHRLGQITEGSYWLQKGRAYSCTFDRAGIRDDRGYIGRAG